MAFIIPQTGRKRKGFVQLPIERHGAQTDRNPQQTEGQADLSVEVEGRLTVIPDLVVPVGQQTGEQLHRGDDQRAQQSPQSRREPGTGVVQLAQQQKTGAAGQKHTAMTPPAPEKFQSHIAAATCGK